MLLHNPIMISSRLMPAVKVGNSTISVELSDYRNGRSAFTMYIDFADGSTFECDDLSSPRESLQEALSSYLSFLSASADAYRYQISTGRSSDNIDLFPPHVTEWAYQNSDELSMLSLELEENDSLIEG